MLVGVAVWLFGYQLASCCRLLTASYKLLLLFLFCYVLFLLRFLIFFIFLQFRCYPIHVCSATALNYNSRHFCHNPQARAYPRTHTHPQTFTRTYTNAQTRARSQLPFPSLRRNPQWSALLWRTLCPALKTTRLVNSVIVVR